MKGKASQHFEDMKGKATGQLEEPSVGKSHGDVTFMKPARQDSRTSGVWRVLCGQGVSNSVSVKDFHLLSGLFEDL